MGHADPAPTAVYLTITPRLLGEANPAARGVRRAGVGGGGTMSEAPPLGPLLQCFFRDHLITMKGLRPASVRSHRDTVRLLLVFVAEDRRCKLTRLYLSDLTFDRSSGSSGISNRTGATTSAPVTNGWLRCTPSSSTSPGAHPRSSASLSRWPPSR
jgi:hypothetical protein